MLKDCSFRVHDPPLLLGNCSVGSLCPTEGARYIQHIQITWKFQQLCPRKELLGLWRSEKDLRLTLRREM